MSLRSSELVTGNTISAILAAAVHQISCTITVSGFCQPSTSRFSC